MTSHQLPSQTADEWTRPHVGWLVAGFLLAGLGTVLLGPILPTVSTAWHLSDAQAGSLFFAKFLGAFAGGSTVPKRLRLGILTAHLCTAVGLLAFAMATNLWSGVPALALLGFGLGRLIASLNILAGRRYAAHTGSALATLNFFWSLGAVGTGMLVGYLLPRIHLHGLLITLAAAFLVTGLGGSGGAFRSTPAADEVTGWPSTRLSRHTLLMFGSLLIVYGGLETSLSSWLSTFDSRYVAGNLLHGLLHGQTLLILFWAALTVGRALAAAALRRWPERVVLRLSLFCAVALIVLLACVHGTLAIPAVCIGLGLALAPWFPATFALLLQNRPSAREAGFILALSGIGAAVFPWLTGLVSTHAGSLRVAMAVPSALALALLVTHWRMAVPEADAGT